MNTFNNTFVQKEGTITSGKNLIATIITKAKEAIEEYNKKRINNIKIHTI
jgi:hypothetical protein